MPGELRLFEKLTGRRIDGSNRSASEPDVQSLGGSVVADVVRVVAELDVGRRPKIVGTEQLKAVALPIRYRDPLGVGGDRDPLWLAETRQTPEMRSGLEVEHLDRVVAECCDEQTLRRCVKGEVIDAALDTRQLDGTHLPQRSLRKRAGHHHSKCERTCGSAHHLFLTVLRVERCPLPGPSNQGVSLTCSAAR